MSVSFPPFSGDGDPRPVLVNFLIELKKFLSELVSRGTDEQGSQLFIPSLRGQMQEAWNEFVAENHIENATNSISLLPETAIQDNGLQGKQLQFQLAVINLFNQRYIAVGKSIIRKLIDILDDLLRSILSAIGGGEAISEIKDFIKDSLDD
jgi:hypothetical protein